MANKAKGGSQGTGGSQVTLVVSSGRAPQRQIAVAQQEKAPAVSKPVAVQESEQPKQENSAAQKEQAKPAKPVQPLPQAPQDKETGEQKENKQAKVRYPVPPLSRPLKLEIKATDKQGERTVFSKDVKGGEYITLNIPYTDQLVVTVYLGGEFVWEERYF